MLWVAPTKQQQRAQIYPERRGPRLQYAHTCMQRENCFLIINKVREELSAQDFLSSACFFWNSNKQQRFCSRSLPAQHNTCQENTEGERKREERSHWMTGSLFYFSNPISSFTSVAKATFPQTFLSNYGVTYLDQETTCRAENLYKHIKHTSKQAKWVSGFSVTVSVETNWKILYLFCTISTTYHKFFKLALCVHVKLCYQIFERNDHKPPLQLNYIKICEIQNNDPFPY